MELLMLSENVNRIIVLRQNFRPPTQGGLFFMPIFRLNPLHYSAEEPSKQTVRAYQDTQRTRK